MASKISAVDRGDRLLHALAEIALLVAVAQLDRLVRPGRGAGRHGGAAARAVLQHDVDLDGRIAAAVEDFAADDVDDGGHGMVLPGVSAGVSTGRERPLSCPRRLAPMRGHGEEKPLQLGRPVPAARLAREALLDRVPNPHPDTDYVARFTAPEFTTLCPVTGQPDFAHLVIDYVPGDGSWSSKSLKLYLCELPQPRRLPRGLHGRDRQAARRRCSSRNGCASAATGIRAAACRSTCSGRPGKLPKGVWVPDQGVAPYRGRG